MGSRDSGALRSKRASGRADSTGLRPDTDAGVRMAAGAARNGGAGETAARAYRGIGNRSRRERIAGYNRTMTNGHSIDAVSGPAALEERLADLARLVDTLIGVVSRLDEETSDTAAAAFDSSVPRLAGHKATAEDLKTLGDTPDRWLKEWGAGDAR
jgi:hypothetical protein